MYPPCPHSSDATVLKSDLSSLDFVVHRLFMKLFKTSNIDVVKCCQDRFGFDLPSVSWSKRVKKFEAKFHACNNLGYCVMCCEYAQNELQRQ